MKKYSASLIYKTGGKDGWVFYTQAIVTPASQLLFTFSIYIKLNFFNHTGK